MAKRIVKIIYKSVLGVLTAVLIIFGACCGYIAVQRARGNELPTIFGFAVASVVTGSMEPEISVGDLIVIKSCSSYSEDDVITFYDQSFGGYITHRIISIEDGVYITKGDANTAADSGVSAENIVGKVVAVVGGAGSVISFLQTPAGIICIIGAAVAIWLVIEIVETIVNKDKKKD